MDLDNCSRQNWRHHISHSTHGKGYSGRIRCWAKTWSPRIECCRLLIYWLCTEGAATIKARLKGRPINTPTQTSLKRIKHSDPTRIQCHKNRRKDLIVQVVNVSVLSRAATARAHYEHNVLRTTRRNDRTLMLGRYDSRSSCRPTTNLKQLQEKL